MYGADYVWILQESENKSWWNEYEYDYEKQQFDCSFKHLHEAVENVFIISSYNHIVGEEKSISGLVIKKSAFEVYSANQIFSLSADKYTF